MPVHFTSFAFCGANPAMPFWEQNWGLEREGILGAYRETSQHFLYLWKRQKYQWSSSIWVLQPPSVLLGEMWNLGGYLKCLFHRVWLCSWSVTISCPLQRLLHGGTASLVCASVWFISLQKIQILSRQQGNPAGILYIPAPHFCVWRSNFLSRFWKLMPGWLWCPGGHSILFN